MAKTIPAQVEYGKDYIAIFENGKEQIREIVVAR